MCCENQFFRQDDVNAVDRTFLEKAREVVSLDDFMLATGGNARDALEKASAYADVVNIYDGTYEFDQAADIAADTIIIGHGCVIKPAAGYTDPNLMNFLGSGALEGTGSFSGIGMPSPVTTWVGVGIPVGSAIFCQGVENDNRYTLEVTGWTFSGFPGGLIFAKWVILLKVDSCRFFDNQKASVQWKASGNYFHIATTNAGTSTDPIGEIITDHGIQVYQSTEARITRTTMIDIRSKGISLDVDFAILQGNIMVGASPRHCMEHLTGCMNVITTGNSYDGGCDKGDAVKPVECDAVTLGGGSIRSSTIGYYIQDCGSVTLIPGGMEAVANPYWAAHSNLAKRWMSISGHVGEVNGDGTGKFLNISSHAEAVFAGYGMKIHLAGGHASAFTYGMFHATSGLGMILDIALVGGIHFENCTTSGLDLRARSIDIDAKFTGCKDSLSIGSTFKSLEKTVTASLNANVKAVFENCSGTHCRVGAQAVYNCQFETINLDLAGNGGARILSFGLAPADVLNEIPSDNFKMLSAKVRGYNQSITGSAVYIDGGGFAFKGSLDIAIIDSSASPNYVTFANAASMTGDFKNRVCDITGTHGLTL